MPASVRTEGSVRIDNDGYKLDLQGYRIDNNGERLGMVDVPEKTAGDKSNAVAGYYISSTGQVAPGRVATTSDVVAPPRSEPTPLQMPQQAPISPAPANILPHRGASECPVAGTSASAAMQVLLSASMKIHPV
jgi:hypothetical protein